MRVFYWAHTENILKGSSSIGRTQRIFSQARLLLVAHREYSHRRLCVLLGHLLQVNLPKGFAYIEFGTRADAEKVRRPRKRKPSIGQMWRIFPLSVLLLVRCGEYSLCWVCLPCTHAMHPFNRRKAIQCLYSLSEVRSLPNKFVKRFVFKRKGATHKYVSSPCIEY
jgi:hypothetical protein